MMKFAKSLEEKVSPKQQHLTDLVKAQTTVSNALALVKTLEEPTRKIHLAGQFKYVMDRMKSYNTTVFAILNMKAVVPLATEEPTPEMLQYTRKTIRTLVESMKKTIDNIQQKCKEVQYSDSHQEIINKFCELPGYAEEVAETLIKEAAAREAKAGGGGGAAEDTVIIGFDLFQMTVEDRSQRA